MASSSSAIPSPTSAFLPLIEAKDVMSALLKYQTYPHLYELLIYHHHLSSSKKAVSFFLEEFQKGTCRGIADSFAEQALVTREYLSFQSARLLKPDQIAFYHLVEKSLLNLASLELIQEGIAHWKREKKIGAFQKLRKEIYCLKHTPSFDFNQYKTRKLSQLQSKRKESGDPVRKRALSNQIGVLKKWNERNFNAKWTYSLSDSKQHKLYLEIQIEYNALHAALPSRLMIRSQRFAFPLSAAEYADRWELATAHLPVGHAVIGYIHVPNHVFTVQSIPEFEEYALHNPLLGKNEPTEKREKTFFGYYSTREAFFEAIKEQVEISYRARCDLARAQRQSPPPSFLSFSIAPLPDPANLPFKYAIKRAFKQRSLTY